jgi:aspartyl aminopeptidase
MAKRKENTDLKYKRDNGWNKISASEKKKIDNLCKEYLDYLSDSKTEREAHDNAIDIVNKIGCKDVQNLNEKEKELKPGTLFYFSKSGKTLMVVRIGKRPLRDGLRIIGGHTDVPHLDLKPVPLYEDNEICLLDTHYYGGIKKYQWVTMPLALHGVVVKEDGSVVKIVIGEKDDEPVFCITDILPHLGKDQSKKTMGEGVTGEGLNALFGNIPANEKGKDKENTVKANILKILNDSYGITEEDLISAELQLVPAGRARELGIDRSMIIGFGQDDRICSYTALKAFVDTKELPEYTSVILLCDKEEVGSIGATGMNSNFFENCVSEMIGMQEGADYSDLSIRRCMSRSKMISADVGALHDPNYPEVSSPNNMAKLNAGIIISKYLGSGGKGGSNDATAEFVAEIRKIFNDNDVIWQPAELGKVDQGGGGTIAIFLAKYGMDVIDSGIGLLSMHAPWEVAGKFDTYMAYKGYKAFLKSI